MRTILRFSALAFAAIFMFSDLLSVQASFVFEDRNVLPWTGPIPHTFRLHYLIWGALKLAEPWQYHWLNLGVHALTSLMVGLVGFRLRDLYGIRCRCWIQGFDRDFPNASASGWACGSIFWLSPLAVPAVGYASALPEMLVCLGAVTLTWTLLQDRTWYWLCAAGVILFITLNVKSTAIGVLLLPVVSLIVRPIQWRASAGWIIVGVFLTFIVGVTFAERVSFIFFGNTYPWHRWPEEMLPQAAYAGWLAVQSILPMGIAFQIELAPAFMGGIFWIIWIGYVATAWASRRRFPIFAFSFFYILALITVRLVVPASNWLDRAPEMWYTQQWYPALPGMVWGLVSVFADDASHGERSVR